MKTDSATWRRWLDLDLEGELPEQDQARLAEIARTDERVAAERRALESLHRMIKDDQIAVRPGFTARVMSALPRAWWEERGSAGLPVWALPLAMTLILALGGATLLVGAEETGRFTGIGLAVIDFMQVTFLAGAGMLFATWRGIGFGLEQLIADSGMNLLAMIGAVVFLNLLFFSLLRRPSPVSESTRSNDAL